jgi:NSS family neurotransmitter:Na+ symporter
VAHAPAPSPDAARGAFGSQLGFILAAAGSAVGLGNIWRFPYTVGQYGGGAFILIYLAFVIGLGIPVLLSEIAAGRATSRNPVGAYRALAPSTAWWWVGALGVATGFGILAFYSVIAGWTLAYLWMAVTGTFGQPMTADASAALFSSLIADPVRAIGLSAAFLLATMGVVRAGVAAGIESASKYLMPAFFVVLLALAIRSVTLPGAAEGIAFLTRVDFSKVGVEGVMSAMGQALFSLSLGMGAMITYGSYLPKRQNVATAAASVAAFDTTVALIAGFVVFPAVFAGGGQPSAGPSLVFVTLPTIFDKLPLGGAFAVAFYGLLVVAALTSTISLLEVVVSYTVDELGWSRTSSVLVIGGGCFALAVPSALSFGAVAWLGDLGGRSFFDWQDKLWGEWSLAIGALLLCVFVGWVWGVEPAQAELEASGQRLPGAGLWRVLVRFVAPALVLAVFLHQLGLFGA